MLRSSLKRSDLRNSAVQELRTLIVPQLALARTRLTGLA